MAKSSDLERSPPDWDQHIGQFKFQQSKCFEICWTIELLGFDSTIPTLSWWMFEAFLEIFILTIGEDEAVLTMIFSNGLKAEITKYCFWLFGHVRFQGLWTVEISLPNH